MTINSNSIAKVLIVIGVAFLVNYFSNHILRYGWKMWIGKEICWRNIKLFVDDDYFVFQNTDSSLFSISNDQPILIGKFDTSKTTFPNESYIMIGDAKFDIDRLSEALSKLCARINCENYKKYSYIENGVPVTCIQFEGTSETLDNRQFHVFCKVQASKILVEYHGSQDNFDEFKTQQQQTIKAIATSVINP
jgi:hypothetical protein